MTFTELVNGIADEVGVTSATALARIARNINIRYRWLASSIGFETVGRAVVTATTTIGNRSLVFACEKVLAVYNTAYTPAMVLDLGLFDDLRNEFVATDPPTRYAIQLMGASTVTIYLNSAPATQYVLTADCLQNQPTLSGGMIPAFAEDYHDILTYGPKAIELKHKQREAEATLEEKLFDQRLAELRFYIAKSAYLDTFQGKTADDARAIVPPMAV